MNKALYILLMNMGFLSTFAQGKPEFGMTLSTYSGTAMLEQKNRVDLNGFVRGGGEATARLCWDEQWGIFAGIGTYAFYGNRTTLGETTSLKNTYILIPFGVSYGIPLIKKDEDKTPLRIQIDVGGYAGSLIKKEEDSVDFSSIRTNLGWNFGVSGKLGMVYRFHSKFDFGLGIEAKRDLTDIESQMISQSNALYASLGYRFR